MTRIESATGLQSLRHVKQFRASLANAFIPNRTPRRNIFEQRDGGRADSKFSVVHSCWFILQVTIVFAVPASSWRRTLELPVASARAFGRLQSGSELHAAK